MTQSTAWNQAISRDRFWLSKLYYGWFILVLAFECQAGRLMHQLENPVLISPAIDNTYWLIHLMGIPQAIASVHYLAVAIEMALLLAAIICFCLSARFPAISILFTAALLVYMVTKNSVVAHQEHGIDAPFLMSIIFWSKKEVRFSLLFRSFRYYVLFIFVSAACWKLFRGSVFLPGQMSEILKYQHLESLSEGEGSLQMEAIRWMINHPGIGHAVLIIAMLLQLSFIAGFVTHRMDTWLLLGFFLFFFGDWFLMGLSFYQTWVAGAVFLPWVSLRSAQQKQFPLAAVT